jgi:ABC-2 type transport system permease protein
MARLRSDWQYRTSFLTLTTTQALFTALEFVALVFIVDLVPALGDWTKPEVAFLYALAAVPFGLSDVVVSPLETTSRYIQFGEFDRLLLRPVSPLLQIAGLDFELRRAGRLVPPIGVLVWAVANVDIAWSAGGVALLLVALSCGTVIYSALWVLTASVSFWAVASKEATNAFTYGGQFANEYPLHLYRGWLRLILGWAVPLAFVSYVPSQHLLGAANPLGLPSWLVFTTPAVTAGIVVVSLAVWRLGIRHYQSTGS